MTDAPKTIWARVRTYTRLYGVNSETEESRDWCEGYATPEIAETCGAREYTLTSAVAAQLKAADELAEAASEIMVDPTWGLEHKTYMKLKSKLTAYRKAKDEAQ